MARQLKPANDMTKLITLDDAATRLGVSRRTIDRYIERGDFVQGLYQMPSGLLRCDEHDFNAWLASRRTDNQPKENTHGN
jgi:predicted DNA-binding transcriptional regulator AlpA